MTLSSILTWVPLALALAGLAGLLILRVVIRGREEPAHGGYDRLRRRMGNLAGRGHVETRTMVVPAVNMPGWVWFAWTRRSGEPLVERSGWSPLHRSALRAAERARGLR